MKLEVLKFSLAGGIIGAICMGWVTMASLIGVPGFLPFARFMEQGYGSYGYSISWLGVFIGVFSDLSKALSGLVLSHTYITSSSTKTFTAL